ncbi:exoribonuclease R [Vibrio aestuarianus]|uniref:exoribonuclease R n=1 Tax=Vibrio aestuarianus TaxID=28171 RepID=UPI00237CBFA3|nr:exoribonuclease R [Vibrio aestuarianus]MDE1221829.1 exoribonuclease R [Vibrio aestuarianus]MDE1337127.1 exoribonuclease R [Vibrio aestuarianus]
MQRDYAYECLNTMPREELEEFSLRMLHRLVPETMMNELFTFEQEEVEDEARLQAAQFDAMLRMHAIALSEIPALFSDSDNANQNSERMIRLVLWHFYALSFCLEKSITLSVHCAEVENILRQRPTDAFAWSKILTDLLYRYADLNAH